ncbi:hypothetical protein AVEN_172750-1 [Araneus ventricosus]|uniref:DDE-1 domain-containing protein n=1 Tax=Araneus ventricosus TaxID=182803 RepID=A0A4Y2BKQ5_ARAVE|nr:hypothetical protein AVEN_172750-1 [Araneus ventricosus]
MHLFVKSSFQNFLPSLLKDYKADDVFNADETGLFFQCLPNKTAAFKGKEWQGGEQGKLRVTLLLAANRSVNANARRNVIETTIKNCFIKAGFSENKTSSETEEVDSIKYSIGEGEINPEQWVSIQKDCNTNVSFEDFMDVDNELQTCGTITDKKNINAEISDEENEEFDQQEH